MSETSGGAGVAFRAMLADDLDQVVEIERLANSRPWSRAKFQDSLNAGHVCWVCYQDATQKEITGYAIVARVLDEASLLNICITPACQGKGMGLALLRALLEWADSIPVRSFLLEVRRSNKKAIRLYRFCGFGLIGTRKEYYPADGRREDALVFCRQSPDHS